MSNHYPERGATQHEGARPDPPSAPYGPQPHGVDEAAGGADSSPYETDSSGERERIAEEGRARRRDRDDSGGRRP
jgi:hypothetical protein